MFPQGYMAAGLIMPHGPPPAASWLWAGGWGDGRMGMEAEAPWGPQSLSHLDPGFRVLTRRPTPHSERQFPVHTSSDGSALYTGRHTSAPMHTQHTMHPHLVCCCYCCFVFAFSFNFSLFSTEIVWGTVLLRCPPWYI